MGEKDELECEQKCSTHTHARTRTHTHTDTHTPSHTHTHTLTNTQSHIHTHTLTCTNTQVCNRISSRCSVVKSKSETGRLGWTADFDLLLIRTEWFSDEISYNVLYDTSTQCRSICSFNKDNYCYCYCYCYCY